MERVVAIDARMTGYSGIGTYLQSLLENYARTESDFLFRLASPRQEFVCQFGSARFTWVRTDAPIYSLREQWQIPRAAEGSDLLHSPHYNIPCFYRGKLLVTIHDLTHITDRTFRRSLPALVYAHPMLAAASRKADHIVAVSEFTKQQIVDRLGVRPEKITAIHHGISSHFRAYDHEEAFRAASSALQLRRPYLLYVGALKPHKNLSTLIRAFALLYGRRKVELLLIVGDDSKWKKGLVSLCSQLRIADRVAFVRPVSYELLPKVYAGADLLVLPSFIEGFGLPVLEAMACGTPVICSRAASLPEVAGDAAEFFEPSGVDDLAEAIERVLDSPARQSVLRQKGLKRAGQFSWQECARRHLEVYRKVLES